jgi:hypothetical protein
MMRSRTVCVLAGLLWLAGCDDAAQSETEQTSTPMQDDTGPGAGDTGASAPEACAPSSQLGVSDPYENTILELQTPTTQAEFVEQFEVLLGPDALRALGTANAAAVPVEIAPGLTLVATADISAPSQIRLQVTTEPVADVYPEGVLLADVAVSVDFASLFFNVAQRALGSVRTEGRDESTHDDFDLGMVLHDDRGGEIQWDVGSRDGVRSIRFRIATPRTSILPGRVNEPFAEGAVWERMWARAPIAIDFASIRTVLLSGATSDGGAASAGVCGSSDIDATTAPHSWYQFCVDTSDPIIEVQLGLKDSAGAYRPLALAPATLPAATLWALTGDRVASTSIAGVAPPVFRVGFDYSDPNAQGSARIDLERAGARYRMFHEQSSPPRPLVAGAGAALPDPSLLDPGTPTIDGDLCEVVGGRPADEGRFLLTFVASAGLSSFSNLTFPVSGRLYGAVYPADQVGLTGPVDGAIATDTFEFDLTVDREIGRFRYETAVMPAGDYKVTAFLDRDGSVDPANVQPSSGDPAVLQFVGTPLRCDRQLQIVEFAVTVP